MNSRGSIAQSAVGMHLVIVGEPARQLVDDTLRIWPGVHADIIPLEGVNERLRHAIRLGTTDWGGGISSMPRAKVRVLRAV